MKKKKIHNFLSAKGALKSDEKKLSQVGKLRRKGLKTKTFPMLLTFPYFEDINKKSGKN
jgi:hypothetical protein